MKISKMVVAALFVAGFITTSASAGFAEDKPEDAACAVGYTAIEIEDGMYTCYADAEILYAEPKPIDSCWETPEGVDVCARGAIVPEPATAGEETPVEGSDCSVSVDAEGNELSACYDAVPYEATPDDKSFIRDGEEAEMTDDETLMYQSGVATPASESNNNPLNTIAAVVVLAGALGAFGMGIKRQRAGK
jgi:hypothetical protein